MIPSRWHPPGRGTLLPLPDVALRALGARLRHADPRADALRDALLEGDPLADEVVAWMDGRAERRAMLDRAIARGVDKDAPPELARFFAAIDRVPAWVDRETIALATDTLLRCARSGTYALGGASLMSGYLSSGAVKPLVATGLLLTMARRRISETGKFLRDVAVSGTLERFSDGIQSAIHVRILHAVIRKRLLASGRWRANDWGTPINQRDMVGTNLEFSVAYIGGLTALGCLLSRREREAIMHLWRWVGLVVGVREDLLPKTFAEGLELAWMFNGTELGPDDDSRALASALVEAWSPGLPGRHAGAVGKLEGRFLTGFARFVLGRRAADALALPNDAWKYAPLVVMPVRASVEALRSLVPGARERAVRRGRTIIEREVRAGLADGPATFNGERHAPRGAARPP